jgi:cyclophilin family peptidyl-prolyl cis-trans isomerase
VSKKQHDKQLDRARKKRRDSKFDRRTTRNRVVILVMAVLMVLSLVGAALTSAISGSNDPAPAADEEPIAADEGPGPCGEAPDDVPEVDSEIYDEPFELTIDTDASYVATIDTTCGDIVVELDVDDAPIASNNLVNLAEDGYYEGVVFHRVIPEFVIQAGDPLGTGCGQEACGPDDFDPDAPTFPGYDFEDELDTAEALYEQVRQQAVDDLRAAVEAEGEDLEDEIDEELLEQIPGGYPRGTVAMANAGPDTNGSQFYIAQGDPTALPGPQFTVLGTVIEGMDVVDAIAASPTDASDRPIEAVTIRSITIDQR